MCAAALARPMPRFRELDEPDTLVIDLEEDDVQVLLLDRDGRQRWHRRANIEPSDHTGCGRRYDWRFEQLGQRMSRLEGELCQDGCFTPFELDHAAQQAARGRERR